MNKSTNQDQRIAIIDHVGIRAGMNYYNDGLMHAINNRSIKAYIFSNYIGKYPEKIKYYQFFEGFSEANKFLRLIRFIKATIVSALKARAKSVNLVFLHIFSGQFVFLVLALIPRLLGLRVSIILHDIKSFGNSDWKFNRYIINNLLAHDIIVHNDYSYQELIRNYSIRKIKRVHIIKHGGFLDFVDSGYNYDSPCNTLFEYDSKKRYILFFGQNKPAKGLDLLIEAMLNVNNDVQLIVAGKINIKVSDCYDRLSVSKKLMGKVHIIDRFITHKEMLYLFRISDILVLPYTKIYQSGVLLIAMSYGLPVLASDLAAFKEIIEHEKNGLLFESNNINDLRNQINNYIINDKLLREIAANARKLMKENYSWDNIAEKYLRLL